MEMEQGGGAKDLFKTIVSHPPLLITVLAGVGLVAYLLIRNGPQGQATTATIGTTGINSSTSPDYSAYQQGFNTGYQFGSYSVPSPSQGSQSAIQAPPSSTNPIPDHPTTTTTTTVPVPTTTVGANNPQYSGITRALRQNDTYDKQFNSVPVTSSAGGHTEITRIPFGATVTVLGEPVKGDTSPQGTNAYYQVNYQGKTGYISSYDLPTVYTKGQ